MLGRTPVIDADAHKSENPTILAEFLEGRYRHRLRVVADAHGEQRIAIDDRNPRTGAADLLRVYPQPDGLGKGAFGTWHPEWSVGALFNRVRLSHMDREGIDAQVIYPSLALACGSLIDSELAVAFCRAYNDYIRDDCASHANRLFPVGVLPLQDVTEAIAEMRRCVDELGMIAVMISPSLPIPHPDAPEAFPRLRAPLHLSDPRFFPLYEAAENLDITLAVHGAPGFYLCSGVADQVDSFTLVDLFAERGQMQMALAKLVMDGVFERFPKLRFGFVGAGCGWLPDFVHALSEHWRIRVHDFKPDRGTTAARLAWESLRERPRGRHRFLDHARSILTMLESPAGLHNGHAADGREHHLERDPAEYFARGQIFTTVTSNDPAPIYMRAALGPVAERMACWGSEYGHWDGVVRGCVAGIREHPEISIDFAERLLVRNALRFYGRRLEERIPLRMGSKRKQAAAIPVAAAGNGESPSKVS